MCRAFNIRVYGLLYNEQGKLLLTDENRFGREFTKFPGGGLKKGEGMHDCLIREFKEELDIVVYDLEHLYTTDFYQESAFNSSEQIISVYYKVKSDQIDQIKVSKERFDFCGQDQIFRWASPAELQPDELTFPIDKHILSLI